MSVCLSVCMSVSSVCLSVILFVQLRSISANGAIVNTTPRLRLQSCDLSRDTPRHRPDDSQIALKLLLQQILTVHSIYFLSSLRYVDDMKTPSLSVRNSIPGWVFAM